MGKYSRCDVASLCIVFLAGIFSLVRFNFLPQFLDGYYHLATAQGFLASGGFSGWAWWECVPAGRPHLYPPLYHIVLSLFSWCGYGGLFSLRFTESLIVGVFFVVVWITMRQMYGRNFAFFAVACAVGFFPFYGAVSAYVPASFAMIGGLGCWYFFSRRNNLAAALCLGAAFYAHASVPWFFAFSLAWAALFVPGARRGVGVVLVLAAAMALPFFAHCLRYGAHVHAVLSNEALYTQIDIAGCILACVGGIIALRNRDERLLLFSGYCICAGILFWRYPYRFFSAQGFLGIALLAAGVCASLCKRIPARVVCAVCGVYFLGIHSTCAFENGSVKILPLHATFTNIVLGNFGDPLKSHYHSLFYPRYYIPALKAVQEHAQPLEPIASNLDMVAQVFAALAQRPSITAMLFEVKPDTAPDIRNAALLVWLKDASGNHEVLPEGLWNIVFENELFFVVRNQNARVVAVPGRAWVPFWVIGIFCGAWVAFFVYACKKPDILSF